MLKIVISYPTAVPNEMDLVNELLDSDIDYFHIRKLGFTNIDLTKYIEAINEDNHHKIMINSNYTVLNKFTLAGIHLNQKNLGQITQKEESHQCHIEPMLQNGNKILVSNQIPNTISYSAHSFSEIAQLTFKTDYIFLAPIFDSISKTEHLSNFTNQEKLKENLTNTNQKIIALGGVKPEYESQLKDLGFAGYAVLGDYWTKFFN
ncbi:MAG: thiamine phosphate synthase [Putridiphycobacter sp.]|nr:thiamine phosphate synthase [Putridiphycobacter sp.]